MRRVALAVVGALTVAAGLLVHTALPETAASDAAGDALYAVLVYLLAAFAAPRARLLVVAAAALAWCTAVELLQLTGLPARWGAAFPPLLLVLGTVFSAADLAWYAAGVAIAAGADAALRALRAPGRRPTGARGSR
ncbi:DUF2809 domain-containing protein [Microbacterium sp. JZ37]|uniref:ribosomal maturation YjgA family protein n=1 Tax=Microbacterium sp. JZ37 TaxID=2654193 RepID=UPI002B478EB5|nr:DUF2809 domain-containing protein [Microbacterium sp. JZ37]WRH17387.1 DUF2809 domain-containing protein [Microbacterium sp. JZ37]